MGVGIAVVGVEGLGGRFSLEFEGRVIRVDWGGRRRKEYSVYFRLRI